MKVLPVLCLLALSATAAEVDGNKITLTDAEAARCSQGCVLITARALAEIRAAFDQLLAERAERVKGCRRADLI